MHPTSSSTLQASSAPAEREAGVARMTQKGVIMTDYLSIIVEIMRTNADPKAQEIYEALDVDLRGACPADRSREHRKDNRSLTAGGRKARHPDQATSGRWKR